MTVSLKLRQSALGLLCAFAFCTTIFAAPGACAAQTDRDPVRPEAAHPETGKAPDTLIMTTVSQTINPSAAIDLAALVTAGGMGPVPTGEITFVDEGTDETLGTARVDKTGAASKTITGLLSIGGHNIAAKYSGDVTYAAIESLPVTINVEKSTTSTTVVPSTTAPLSGEPLEVKAEITAVNPGETLPSGVVNFTLDGVTQGTRDVTEGSPSTATMQMTLPSSGAHNIQAMYSGDVNYDNSTSPVVIVTIKSKGATVTTLSAMPVTLTPNTAETLTATVAPENNPGSNSLAITGTVSFYDGVTLLGSPVPVNPVSGVFTATLTGVKLSTTVAHIITAVYTGDSNWLTSSSAPLTLQSKLLADSVTLAASVTTVGPGQTVTLTATVTPATAPGTGVEAFPTGNVIFYDGSTVLGTVALAAATGDAAAAALTTNTLPAGKNAITAKYVGDTYYLPGTSAAVTLDVQDFTIVPTTPAGSPGNLTIVQGDSGSVTYDVNGLGGFNNQIHVVCAVPGALDMTCTVDPQVVSPPGKVTVTVNTFSTGTTPPASANSSSRPLWGGSAAIAMAGLLLWPRRRRRGMLARGAGWLMLLLAAGLASMGCGGSVAPVGSGTPLGVATLKITAAGNIPNTVVSHDVYLSVNVIAQ